MFYRVDRIIHDCDYYNKIVYNILARTQNIDMSGRGIIKRLNEIQAKLYMRRIYGIPVFGTCRYSLYHRIMVIVIKN